MFSIRLSKQGWAIITILVVVLFITYLSNVNPIARLQGNVISIRRLLTLSVRLAEDAGRAIKQNYAPVAIKPQLKGSGGGPRNELVTELDLKSHQIIVSGFNGVFKDLEIISEEHPPVSDESLTASTTQMNLDNRLSDSDLLVPVADLAIWVDPLDATQELTEGLLEYITVMICVALHGHPIVGVIHQPFLNRTYWSWKSHGISEDVVQALANATNNRSPLNRPLVITYSRSHLDNSTAARITEALKPQNVVFIPAGGSGYKVLSLLSGKAQLYIHPAGIRRWDICAPYAILDAIGGRMTGLDGSLLTFNSDDPPKIPQTTGLFAASSFSSHDNWRAKLASLARVD